LEVAHLFACSADELLHIARGAYLHDIGKIGIPDAILRKPGKLTPAEFSIMKTHVSIGCDLLDRIPFLAPARELVCAHHETFNGSGYPRGLRGDQIPLGARIFAVVDALDAMTSDRPYRQALPMATAREEIARESGRQFDPDVVEAFFAIPEEAWANIRFQVAREGRRIDTSVSKCLEGLTSKVDQFPLWPSPREENSEGGDGAKCGGYHSLLEELASYATVGQA
jgi:HD-GYP domain-containing protein (c-di-GMP phosphodiesterase class II)